MAEKEAGIQPLVGYFLPLSYLSEKTGALGGWNHVNRLHNGQASDIVLG